MPRYNMPTGPKKSFIFDLETTGLIQRFQPELRGDVGISEFALREAGKPGGYQRFTNLLQDPLIKYDAGDIDARAFAEMIEAKGPTGVRWQKGFKNPENVLHGVFERHVDVTRGAIAGRGDILAKESKLVSLMTRYLRQGHNIKGWNLDFDMTVMSRVAARSSPAVQQRWSRAINIARSRGQIEDMATGAKKFMYLAAQESAMQGKNTGREFFTLGQVDKKIVNLVKEGKLNVGEIDKLSYDKLTEKHKGFEEFFARRLKRKGRADISYERYEAWLRRKHSYLSKVEQFATGQKYPNIRMTKGWSADILLRTLAPEGIKGSTLEKKAMELAQRGGLKAHEGLSDTVFEETLDKIFRVKSKTWAGTWDEMSPRLREYGIESQEQFFHRYRSAIEIKGKTQLKEHALEATRQVDNRWQRVLSEKTGLLRSGHKEIAAASRSQPETLRRIYSQAGRELSGKWRMFKTANPKIALTAQVLAGAAIADFMIPDRERPTKGVRDPDDAPYLNINGIGFGASGRGVARALTDFGSGRQVFNPQTRGYAELLAYRSSLSIKYPDMYGIDFKTLEKSHETWTSALSSAHRDTFTRDDYSIVKAAQAKTRGLNSDAWVGIMDLKSYKVKVEDADTIMLQRKGVMGMFRKPVSVRLAGIDAPEVEHPGIAGRVAQDQFAGREASEYLEKLIERQQSLRLVVDPKARSYNRNVGVLIGDRRDNLNLQMVRSGAAAASPWGRSKRQVVDDNVFVEAEAKAAAGGLGMWQSKGWQMHRAMGIIAGQRVTNTTLTSLERVAKSRSLMAWYGLVQNAHDDKARWSPQDMQRMYQVGTAHRAEVTGAVNRRTAEIGHLPGLRKPVNPWQIAGHGINPSRMRGANISDFSSGRSLVNQEQLLRLPQGDDALSQALRKTGLMEKEFYQLTRRGGRRDIRRLYEAANFFQHGPMEEQILRSTSWSKIPSIGLTNVVGEVLDRTRSYGDLVGAPGVSTGAKAQFGQITKHARRLQARGMWDANIIDLIGHGKAGEAGRMVEYMLDGLESFQASDYKGLHRKAAIERMHRVRPDPGLSAPRIQRQIWQDDIQRESLRAKQLLIRRASHRPPRIATPNMIEGEPAARPGVRQAPETITRRVDQRITAKRPDAVPVEKAIKQATKDIIPNRVPMEVPKGTSSRAAKTLAFGKSGHGAAIGVGIAAAAGLAIGTWALLRGRDEDNAATLAGTFRNSPGEFVAMKSHPPFYSSSKAAAWAEHQAMGDPTDEMTRAQKGMLFAYIGAGFLPMRVADSPYLKAWDYFHNATGVIRTSKFEFASGLHVASKARAAVIFARCRTLDALKKQGFTNAEITRWMDQTKASKGFVAKITKDPPPTGWVGKIKEKWKGIKEFPGTLISIMDSKKSQMHKGYASSIQQWFSGLSTRLQAAGHGLSADQYTSLVKAGKINEVRKITSVRNLSRQKETFKYLWKNLVKDPSSWQTKVSGFRQIFTNLGRIEEMKMAHQANLMNLSPAKLFERKNILTKIGQRLKIMTRRSTFFASKYPNAAKKMASFGSKLKIAGVSRFGRVLGKVPIMSTAFGILEGVEMMGQYENSYKGFAIEAAAGTAGSVVELAIMNQVVAAGKIGFTLGAKAGAWAGGAIGALFGGAGAAPGAFIGGAIGAILGTVIAVAGTIAVGLIAGHITRGVVRGAGRVALGARMKRTVDPAAYLGPETLYPAQGFPTMRQNMPQSFTRFHGMDPARPDLVPFGGAYNPIQGQDIDTRTLQIANNRRRVTAKPRAARPISMFTPTFGLVNIVLWKKRHGSMIRSVVERGASRQRLPRQSRNASRMLAHAA